MTAARHPMLPVRRRPPRTAVRETGFTMIELMIALLIGLFLMGGLLTLVQDNKRAFNGQSQLAQLQDSERFAMSSLADVIQQAGYFPNPAQNTAATAFGAINYTLGAPPATYTYALALGQAIGGTGTGSTTGTGDTLLVRYATAGTAAAAPAVPDALLDCTGRSSPIPLTFVNAFSVVVDPAGGPPQLVCTRADGTAFPLASGVQNMVVLYGVNNSAPGGSNVDTYMTAQQVTQQSKWSQVVSVNIQLTFTNPLYKATNQGQGTQPQTFVIERNIGIMNQIG